MSLFLRKVSGAVLIFACCVAMLGATSAAGDASTLVAVFDRDNLPYSSQQAYPEGLHVEVARMVALQMSRSLHIEWVDTLKHGLLSIVIDNDNNVQMAVGVAVEPRTLEDETLVGRDVRYSVPFASTRYVVATRSDHRPIHSFQEFKGDFVGVESGSVASGVLWDKGFLLRGKNSQEALLDALTRGELAYAVLWNNAAWLVAKNPLIREKINVHLADPGIDGLSWNLAFALRKDDEHLLNRINEAIAALRALHAFRPLFLKYNVPYFEPINVKEVAGP